MVMIYSHAKVQGQRSVDSKDRAETNGSMNRRTDGKTDGGDYITCFADVVGNYTLRALLPSV